MLEHRLVALTPGPTRLKPVLAERSVTTSWYVPVSSAVAWSALEVSRTAVAPDLETEAVKFEDGGAPFSSLMYLFFNGGAATEKSLQLLPRRSGHSCTSRIGRDDVCR